MSCRNASIRSARRCTWPTTLMAPVMNAAMTMGLTGSTPERSSAKVSSSAATVVQPTAIRWARVVHGMKRA